MLELEFKDHDWMSNAEVMAGFKEAVKRVLGEEWVMAALNELPKYKSFNDPVVLAEAKKMASFLFWMVHGTAIGCKILRKLAVLVLPLVSSASSCERNWSAYGFVYNRLRNKLKLERAESLVYVYQNLRLLAKQEKKKGVPEFLAWDPEDNELSGDEFTGGRDGASDAQREKASDEGEDGDDSDDEWYGIDAS